MVETNDVVRGFAERQIGLGTFPFSGVFSPVDAATAHDIIGTFLDLGGRYIETAPIYPVGDVLLGEVLADFPRNAYLLGTKCVTFPDAAGAPQTLGAPQHTRRQVESELARLGVDHLDLVATHRTPTDVSPEEAIEGLETLRAEGLVRMIGVSNASAADLASYVHGGTVDLVQNRYSLVHRHEVDAIADLCAQHGIGINPYQVIERGQLLGAARSRRTGDLRDAKPEYVGDADARIRTWASTVLGPIADAEGITLEALTVRWTFNNPAVTLPVLGATSVAQVRAWGAIACAPLSVDTYAAVEAAVADLESEVHAATGHDLAAFRGLA